MAKNNKWFLPTNTDNLKMMVAQGLITSPDGFSPNKYYKDELENYPGYIPLFKNNIPDETLKLITSEQPNMIACLIEIDLKKIIGKAFNQTNQEVDIDINSNDDLLLLLAPLPLSCVKQIIFKTKKDKESLEGEQKLNSNFILADLKLANYSKQNEALLAIKPNQEMLVEQKKQKTEIPPSKTVDYKKTYAFGGLLINLFYFAKNGDLSNDIYTAFCTKDKAKLNKDILCIYNYFNNSSDDNILQTMYSRLLEKAINGNNFRNDIVVLLEEDDWGEQTKRTQELATMLRSFEDNTTTISEKFSNADKPLEKLLLMLFHRGDSEQLIEYQLDLFTEIDYLLFAIVFGVRDKFIKSTKFIREYHDLQNFISFKMAEYTHQNYQNGGLEFKNIVKPKTTWDILNHPKTRVKAVEKLELKHCVQTVISGDYQHLGNKNIYPGFVEPKYEIVANEYFKAIASKNIDTKTYDDLAKLK